MNRSYLLASALLLFVSRVAAGAVDDDRFWSDRFACPGANGPIRAMAVRGNDLYVAGSFTMIGGIIAQSVARFDGERWWALGTGIARGVEDIAVTDDGAVYVALAWGAYAVDGTDTIRTLARFSSGRWSSPASQPVYDGGSTVVPGTVRTIEAVGNDLVVAGTFNRLAEHSVNGLGLLTPSGWRPMITAPDTAFNGTTEIAYRNGRLVLAGGYYIIGGTETRIVIREGGRWTAPPLPPVTPPTSHYVSFITALELADDGAIYVGGHDARNELWLRRLQAGSWSPLGNDPLNVPRRYDIASITLHEESIVLGGTFLEVGNGIEAYNVVRWNGEYWSRLGDGLRLDGPSTGEVPVASTVRSFGGSLYAAGSFNAAGEIAAASIARWDGRDWHPVIGGSNSTLYTLGAFDGTLWAGGGERAVAGLNVADPVAPVADTVVLTNPLRRTEPGEPGTVRAMRATDQHLYFGGDVGRKLDRGYDQNILRWNGEVLTGVDDAGVTGVNGPVHAIAVDGRNVYIGGSFTQAGPLAVRGLALWDGDRFHDIGAGVNGVVRALAVRDGYLFVGGEFDYAGATRVSNIARHDGVSWSSLDGGVDGPVHALAYDGRTLFVGGQFDNTDAGPAGSFARWSRNDGWSTGEAGFDGPVYAILLAGSELFVGGHFERVGAIAVNSIARFDAERWQPLGSGTNGPVRALAEYRGAVYAAGSFTLAGSKPSFNLARWERLTSSVTLSSALPAAASIASRPNPGSGTIVLAVSLAIGGDVRIELLDGLGRAVRTLVEGSMPQGVHELSIDLGGIVPGVYHCRLATAGRSASTRLVIVR